MEGLGVCTRIGRYVCDDSEGAHALGKRATEPYCYMLVRGGYD